MPRLEAFLDLAKGYFCGLKKPPFLGMAADLVLFGILDSVTATVGGYFVAGDLNLEVLSVNNGLTVI